MGVTGLGYVNARKLLYIELFGTLIRRSLLTIPRRTRYLNTNPAADHTKLPITIRAIPDNTEMRPLSGRELEQDGGVNPQTSRGQTSP